MKEYDYEQIEEETVPVSYAMRVLNIKTRATIAEYIKRGYLKGRRMSPAPKSPYRIYKWSLDEFVKARQEAV